jgi:tetratricopeptide (TPR) repeat protein
LKFLEDTGDEEEYASTHSNASTVCLGQGPRADTSGMTRSPSASRFHFNELGDDVCSMDSTPSGNSGMPESLDALNDMLRLDPDNVKCLFRKGQILMARHEYSEASHCLSRAVGLDPKNGPLQKELVRCLQLKALAPREDRVLRVSQQRVHVPREQDRESCDSRPRSPSAMSSSSSNALGSPPAGRSDAAILAGLAHHSHVDSSESRPTRPRNEIDDSEAPLPARRATKLPFWKKKFGNLINGVGCCGRRGLQSQTQSTPMRPHSQDSVW